MKGRTGKIIAVYRKKWVIHIERVTREKCNGNVEDSYSGGEEIEEWERVGSRKRNGMKTYTSGYQRGIRGRGAQIVERGDRSSKNDRTEIETGQMDSVQTLKRII